MEDDDDDYSIDASPTDPSGSYSNRSQRSRGRITCTKTKPATETQLQCEIVNLGELENCFDLREAQLFEADRLDCLRARQEPARERLVPASQDFQTLQSLLENDQIPMEKTEPEADYEIATQLLSTPLSVVQEILQDFCGSPSYVEVELPTYYDALPWFRFRDKHIKTFARRSATTASTAAITTVTDDDDRSSCSSELSIQEDFTTQVPTATHCAFDANSSQKICENLLNLSAFFTQKNNANLSIDLPEMQTELKDCTLMELKEYDELDDATDVLEDIGYFVGKAEQCKYVDDNCDNKTIASNKTIEVTEAMQKSAAKLMADLEINNQLKREADASDCEMLEGIPFSEWQPMDVPNSLNHEDVEANQLDMILFNEWQPMSDSDDVAFRTASNKAIAISEEKLAEAAKLMADVEASYSQKLREDRHEGDPHSDISGNTEFRTASNKTMKLTEEMRKKAAMLMADLETNCNQLDKIQLKECPAESAECRTASNKTIQITDEKKKAGEKLMAEIEASYSKQLREDRNDGITHSDISGNIEFRTASNKVMEITEEMRKKAAMLMADLETNCNQLDEIHLKQIPPQNISECVQVTKEVVEETVKIVMSDVEAVIPEPPSEANNEITSCARISKDMQKVYEVTATPHQPQTSILEVPFETPKCTPEMESSLTQLTERSPLDRATKSSIITRRNLLSLNKRRKLKRDSEHCSTDASHTPIRLRFTPMAASTSTPVPNRKEDIKEVSQSQRTGRDRSCSQDSPRVAIARVGKRRSEDVLSPIYAPANKTRRLGLSRIRNKSSQDI
ncbi:GH19997 [Drosophila grimshawi]|uniref:GH19997 n=1 Tax=Drosophila grimshawi TaxID=7222 RepID=B4J823_DROGR|nr:GH19997 [Drosophila grimshawi]